jgi:hypothetical protein
MEHNFTTWPNFTPTKWHDNGFFVEMKFKIKNKIHIIHFGLDVTYHNLRPIFGQSFTFFFWGKNFRFFQFSNLAFFANFKGNLIVSNL